MTAADVFIQGKMAEKRDGKPWASKELRKLVATRDLILKRARSVGDAKSEERYLNLKTSEVQRQLNEEHSSYISGFFSDQQHVKSTKKKFYQFQTKNSISPDL